MASVDWVTSAEVKAALGIQGTDRDTEISPAIAAASRALNARCGRELTPQAADATRTFQVQPELRAEEDGLLVSLAPYDLRSAIAATLHPEEASPTVLVANTDYALWPLGPSSLTGTYRKLKLRHGYGVGSTFHSAFGVAKLQIRGNWGAWATADVPEDVKRACIVTVGSWIDKAIAEYGDRYVDEPREMRPPSYSGYAVPRAAVNLLASAGLLPYAVLR